MKRKQKRYETAQSIEAEIDKTLADQSANAKEAEVLDGKADALVKKVNSQAMQMLSEKEQWKRQQIEYQIKILRELAETVREKNPIYCQKLRRLKATLAAFNTAPMPFLEEPSVTLQK